MMIHGSMGMSEFCQVRLLIPERKPSASVTSLYFSLLPPSLSFNMSILKVLFLALALIASVLAGTTPVSMKQHQREG